MRRRFTVSSSGCYVRIPPHHEQRGPGCQRQPRTHGRNAMLTSRRASTNSQCIGSSFCALIGTLAGGNVGQDRVNAHRNGAMIRAAEVPVRDVTEPATVRLVATGYLNESAMGLLANNPSESDSRRDQRAYIGPYTSCAGGSGRHPTARTVDGSGWLRLELRQCGILPYTPHGKPVQRPPNAERGMRRTGPTRPRPNRVGPHARAFGRPDLRQPGMKQMALG